jgi:hypothetical protein
VKPVLKIKSGIKPLTAKIEVFECNGTDFIEIMEVLCHLSFVFTHTKDLKRPAAKAHG